MHLKNFAWANQRSKVRFIFRNGVNSTLLSDNSLYETQSLIKYSYAWIVHTFVNITWNVLCTRENLTGLGLVFHYISKCLAQTYYLSW